METENERLETEGNHTSNQQDESNRGGVEVTTSNMKTAKQITEKMHTGGVDGGRDPGGLATGDRTAVGSVGRRYGRLMSAP